ncbi:MAG: hypothetical protein M1826_002011 [Phylliscum demangeonii]|nr:MAG: hypothetical protein M1826_002011 [Phylliscum demangeonii]
MAYRPYRDPSSSRDYADPHPSQARGYSQHAEDERSQPRPIRGARADTRPGDKRLSTSAPTQDPAWRDVAPEPGHPPSLYMPTGARSRTNSSLISEARARAKAARIPPPLSRQTSTTDALDTPPDRVDLPPNIDLAGLVQQITEDVVRKLHLNLNRPSRDREPPSPGQSFYGSAGPSNVAGPKPMASGSTAAGRPVRRGRRTSVSAPSEDSAPPPPPSRSQGVRVPADIDESPLDKIWGRLFDDDKQATARLGQLLRGMANFIIQDFEPKASIVVTPAKMAKYYEQVKLPSEVYAWQHCFKRLPVSELSQLYQALGCQHHLVPDQPDSAPTIPGLTPLGFERWMTTMLRACPDEEVERLQMAVLQMPISNADDVKERFPKEISRRLFPDEVDRQTRSKVERALPPDAIRAVGVKLDPARAGYGGGSTGVKLERERQPYAGQPANGHHSPRTTSPPGLGIRWEWERDREHEKDRERERERDRDLDHGRARGRERKKEVYPAFDPALTDDDNNDPFPPAVQLERERKPYSAKPGGGKDHESLDHPPPMKSVSSQNQPSSSKPHRTHSVKGTAGPSSTTTTTSTLDIPGSSSSSSRHHRAFSNNVAPQRSSARRGYSPAPPATERATSADRPLPAAGVGGRRAKDGSAPAHVVIDDGSAILDDDINPHNHTSTHHGAPISFDSPRDRERYDRFVETAGVKGVPSAAGGTVTGAGLSGFYTWHPPPPPPPTQSQNQPYPPPPQADQGGAAARRRSGSIGVSNSATAAAAATGGRGYDNEPPGPPPAYPYSMPPPPPPQPPQAITESLLMQGDVGSGRW